VSAPVTHRSPALQIDSDAWLAGLMGRPVNRVAGPVAPGAEKEAARALSGLAAVPGFAYARVPTAEVRLAHLLEDAGFRLVDTGITLEAATVAGTARPSSAAARLARAGDETAVAEIARTAFRYSRFHLDPRIPAALANEIKREWAVNYFRGRRGDYMVVAERSSSVAGFLQLLAGKGGTLTIDLIAVAEAQRGQGLASDMIRFAARECGAPARLRVGTQAANVASLRLYERLGFTVAGTSHVFHLHAPVA
jgi:ribosomal protein S18 acetylase RimI-like enzyme